MQRRVHFRSMTASMSPLMYPCRVYSFSQGFGKALLLDGAFQFCAHALNDGRASRQDWLAICCAGFWWFLKGSFWKLDSSQILHIPSHSCWKICKDMACCFVFIEATLKSLSRGSSHWFFAVEAIALRDAVKLLDELRPKPGRFTPTMQITVMTLPYRQCMAVSYGQVLRIGLVSPKFGTSTLIRTHPCSSLFASSKEERKTKCHESETW